MAAAFMVIAIHIAPFSYWNRDLDFLLTYCLFRVAVPFFFMTTGYFVLAPYVKSGFRRKRSFYKFMVKNTALYLAVTALYLPLTIYSGNLPQGFFGWMKGLLFDGTFYHLWYFPAVLVGCLLVAALLGPGRRGLRFGDLTGKCEGNRNFRITLGTAVVITVIAYIIGLFGDSYYGAIQGIGWMEAAYQGIFQISSYTRNGIFFAPVFLLLGTGIACIERMCPKRVCVCGLALSALLLVGEGFLTYSLKWQRHNSMYFSLLPTMFFLFQLLLMVPEKAPAFTRKGSLVLYVLHPAVIVVLRGLAKGLGLTKVLVDNTFVQYVSVCGVSLLGAFLFVRLKDGVKIYPKGMP
jgi:serine/alanine racemase